MTILHHIVVCSAVLIWCCNVQASWFCKEAASMLQGNTFYACGFGRDARLSVAREDAFAAAKREFHNFCSESESCKENAYNIAPLRTDCEHKDGYFNCHRGLEYTILDQKRSSTSVDKKEISREIERKQHEIDELKQGLELATRNSELTSEIDLLKKLDRKETEVEYLRHANEDYAYKTTHVLAFQMSYLATTLKRDDTSGARSIGLASLGFRYGYKLFDYLAIRGGVAYLFGGRSKTELNERGSPNTSSKTDNYDHQGLNVELGLPFTWGKFSITPAIGNVSISYKSTKYQYNAFGVGTAKTDDKHHYSSSYTGLGLRYGKVFYVEVEPRRYSKEAKTKLTGAVGMQLEF